MDNHKKKPNTSFKQEFARQVHIKEKRKLRARKKGKQAIWFGIGTFGLVGWSVAIPTVLGIFFGIWIDTNWPSRYSWTLMLLILGLAVGCANAWFWIQRERKAISMERKDNDH
ncbi:MAG: AtpZ/AtpI family protein [Desulfobacterales bacterium]